MTTVGRDTDNAETLVWLDLALEYARERRQERLEILLETVRVEILFEMDLTSMLDDSPHPTGEDD